jgi:hypothetical protein
MWKDHFVPAWRDAGSTISWSALGVLVDPKYKYDSNT